MPLTPEQIESRKRGVGCSEILAALGKDPRTSRLELYMRKIGELPELDLSDNERVEAGDLLEPVIRELFARKIGHPITKPDETLFHPELPLVGHPDGFVLHEDEPGIEFKNRDRMIFLDEYGEDGTDQVPLRDLCQCVGYMMLTRRIRWHLGAFVGGNERHLFEIQYDEELAVAIGVGLKEFWSHVEQRRPPDPMTPDDVKLLWPRSIQSTRVATPEIEDLVREHARWKVELKEGKHRMDTAEAQIKHFMAEAGDLVTESGATIASWRSARDSRKFDETTFAYEHPDIYEQYMRNVPGSRRFLNKLTTEVKPT